MSFVFFFPEFVIILASWRCEPTCSQAKARSRRICGGNCSSASCQEENGSDSEWWIRNSQETKNWIKIKWKKINKWNEKEKNKEDGGGGGQVFVDSSSTSLLDVAQIIPFYTDINASFCL